MKRTPRNSNKLAKLGLKCSSTRANKSETISRFFKKIKPESPVIQEAAFNKPDLDISHSEEQQTEAVNLPALNTSLLDESVFESPRKLGKVPEIFLAKSRQQKSPKVARKNRKREAVQVTKLKHLARELDVNQDHLQLALALSKSEPADNQSTFFASSQEKRSFVRKTLEEFGFKTGSISGVHRVQKETRRRKFKSNITPILYIRTEEDRQRLIEEKSLKLLRNHSEDLEVSDPPADSENKDFPELGAEYFERKPASSHLREIFCYRACIYRKNCQKELILKDFYIRIVKPCPSRVDVFLKDWSQIPGRERTPSPYKENIVSNNTNTLDQETDTHTEKMDKKSVVIIEDSSSDETVEETSGLQDNEKLLFDDVKESPTEKLEPLAEITEKIVVHSCVSPDLFMETNDESSSSSIEIAERMSPSRLKEKEIHSSAFYSKDTLHSSSSSEDLNLKSPSEEKVLNADSPEYDSELFHSSNFELVEGISPRSVRSLSPAEDFPQTRTTSGNCQLESDTHQSEDVIEENFCDLTQTSSDDEHAEDMEECEKNKDIFKEKTPENFSIAQKRHSFYSVSDEEDCDVIDNSSISKVFDSKFANYDLLIKKYLGETFESRRTVQENKEVVENDESGSVERCTASPASPKGEELNRSVATPCSAPTAFQEAMQRKYSLCGETPRSSLGRNPRACAPSPPPKEKSLLAEFKYLNDSLNLELAEDDVWQNVRLQPGPADAAEEGGQRLVCSQVETTPRARGDELLVVRQSGVTPMPNYDAMGSPEMNQQLAKFGLKALKRTRGIQMLRHIYDTLHPDKETHLDEQRETEGCRVVKKRKTAARKQIEFVKPIGGEDELGETTEPIKIVGNVIRDGEPLENIYLEKKKSSKIATCALPLDIAWHNYVTSRPKLMESILLYEPLLLEQIRADFKAIGHRFHTEDIISFLDSKCITFRFNQKTGVRRAHAASSKLRRRRGANSQAPVE